MTAELPEIDAFCYEEDTHTYRNAAGLKRPSVTQCLHACGLYDFSKVNPDVLERKRRIGASTHRATAEYDREGWVDETWLADDELPYFAAWKLFRLDFPEMEWVLIEEPMLREVCGMEIGGTPDRVGIWRGVRWVVDIKCAAAAHPAWRLQLADYEMMLTGRTRCGDVGRMTVQLLATGNYRPPLIYDDPTDAVGALAALQLTTWRMNAGLLAA